VNKNETKKLLGATTSGVPQHFHGLNLQEPYKVLKVKIQERSLLFSGKRRLIIIKYIWSLHYIKETYWRGKVFTRNLSQMEKGIPGTSGPLAFLSHLRW